MAEGHVVRYNAERFERILAGKPLVRAFWRSRRVAVPPEAIVGRRVAEVGFAGKNHLFRLDDGATFRVHLMMFGSTQAGPPGEPLRKPEVRVRFLLETADARVVAFSAPIVEYYPPGTAIPALATLGPDALKDDYDAAEVARRLAAAPHATVAEALLDPGVVAGVGNVYKSEILWRAGVHPQRAPGDLTAAERRALARLSQKLMLQGYRSLLAGERPRKHVLVYNRSRQPCLRCGAPLRQAQVGGRRTTWCPADQPAGRPGSPIPAATLARLERAGPPPRRPPGESAMAARAAA